MEKENKIKIGLIPRLVIAIVLGILVGLYLPVQVTQVAVTISANFGKFLNFIIPLMILAFVTSGISELAEGAGKLLLATVLLAYISTIVAGSASYFMSNTLFGNFISPEMAEQIQAATENNLEAI